MYEQLLCGTQEAEAEATPVAERFATLEEEIDRLQSCLATESKARAEQEQTVSCLRGELEVAATRLEALHERCQQLEHEEQQRARDAELDQYRAVAEEKEKWEAQEARLVAQLERLTALTLPSAPVPRRVRVQRPAARAPEQPAGLTEAIAVSGGESTLSVGVGADRVQRGDRQVVDSLLLAPHEHKTGETLSQVCSQSALSGVGASTVGSAPHGGEEQNSISTSPHPQTLPATGEATNPLSLALLAQQIPRCRSSPGMPRSGARRNDLMNG